MKILAYLCFSLLPVLAFAQTDKPWLSTGNDHFQDFDPQTSPTGRYGNVGIGVLDPTSVLRPLHIRRGYNPSVGLPPLFSADRPAIRLESFVLDPGEDLLEAPTFASPNMLGAYTWDMVNDMSGLHFRYREHTPQVQNTSDWFTRFSITHPTYNGNTPNPRFGFNNQNPSSFLSLDGSWPTHKLSIVDDIGTGTSRFSLGADNNESAFLFNIQDGDKFRFWDPEHEYVMMDLDNSGMTVNGSHTVNGTTVHNGYTVLYGPFRYSPQVPMPNITGKYLGAGNSAGDVTWQSATELLYPTAWQNRLLKVGSDGKLTQTSVKDEALEFSISNTEPSDPRTPSRLSYKKADNLLEIYRSQNFNSEPKIRLNSDGKYWSQSLFKNDINSPYSQLNFEYADASSSRNVLNMFSDPAQNWSGKVVEVNGALASKTLMFEVNNSYAENPTAQPVEILDLWKMYAHDDAKKLYIDFNSTSNLGGRVNANLGYWQYRDATHRNIGQVSNFAIQAPKFITHEWEQYQPDAQSMTFRHNPGYSNLVNNNSDFSRSLTLYSPEYRADHDGIAAKVHGKLAVEGIVKNDPSAPLGTTRVGELILVDFDYKNSAGNPVITPHKTLLARDRQQVGSQTELYRLVLGANIPKIGANWTSPVDPGTPSNEGHPSITSLTTPSSTALEQNYLLSVDGLAVFKSVLVMNAQAFRTWGDYVFDQPHPLEKLDTLQAYISENKHLPGIPSAKEIQNNGLDMAQVITEHNIKIEEIYLYLMELKKENQKLKAEIKAIRNEK